MLSRLKSGLAALFLSLMPIAAAAVTTTGLPSGGTFDIAAGPGASISIFGRGDGPGTLDFTISNSSSQALMVTASSLALQVGQSFNGGLSFAWAGGTPETVSQGMILGASAPSAVIAGGGSKLFTISYGMVGGAFLGFAGIATAFNAVPALSDIPAAPVPLPAGGLMLIAALGSGMALVRRRRKAA